MYYDLPDQDSNYIDLPVSPNGKFYTMFSPLHPEYDPQMIIKAERECLKTFYSKNTLPQNEIRSRKRITKMSGSGRKVLGKFDLNYMLY